MIRITFVIFEFCVKKWFKSVTWGFKSLYPTFSLLLQFVKGFEFITQGFELPCFVLHEFEFKDSNRYVGDSNSCFNLFTCSSWGIRIAVLVIRIRGSQLHFFFTRDSNHLNGDSNQSIKVSLIGIRIRILLRGIRITLLMSNCSDLFWYPDSNQLYMDWNHDLQANLLELGFESLS